MQDGKRNGNWFADHPEVMGVAAGLGALLLVLLAAMMKL